MGLHTPDINFHIHNKPGMELNLFELEDLLDWNIVFGNSNPVEIEIGCGKGKFIIQSARENPDTNYFGIEKSVKFSNILKQKVVKAGVTNIRIIRSEADCFISNFVPANSVQAYHIYFPDPWPKRRHNKRRLVNTPFMKNINRSMSPGGIIDFATDFTDYFSFIVETAGSLTGFEEVFRRIIQPSDADPEKGITSYEQKYLLQGRPIYKSAYRKI
jgi:tRNA (guanine-N7-)-methyltransferase